MTIFLFSVLILCYGYNVSNKLFFKHLCILTTKFFNLFTEWFAFIFIHFSNEKVLSTCKVVSENLYYEGKSELGGQGVIYSFKIWHVTLYYLYSSIPTCIKHERFYSFYSKFITDRILSFFQDKGILTVTPKKCIFSY